MAASCVLYHPERTDYLLTSPEPWQDPRHIAPQGTSALKAHLRAPPRDLFDAAPHVPPEEALRLEIDNLCVATLTIDDAFHDIARKLSDAAKEQTRRSNLYDACRDLVTKWNGHHRTYQDLIWRSREFAGEAQAAVDDFREAVLPSLRDQDVTLLEKQEIIQGQLKQLRRLAQPSQDLSQEFLNFGRALDTYIIEFTKVVDSLGVQEQSQKVDELEERLRSARATVEAISQQAKELGWKFATDVLVSGVTFLLACVIPSLCPKLVEVTGTKFDYTNVKRSGLQFFQTRWRYYVAGTEYEAIKARYELEKACLCQMVKLESTLQDARPLVQEVTTKLGIFASVWIAITADIRELTNLLHRTEGTTSQFVLRVQRLEEMYGYLSQALRHYQITVRFTQ